jgi:hypothetical protein
VRLDFKVLLAPKVRVEKREIKVIEDLWALKVLLDQEGKKEIPANKVQPEQAL